MCEPDDDTVNRATAHYPPAEITPKEFEEFVRDLLNTAAPALGKLTVALHETVAGVDGTYDFDATVRFELAGMAFLVLVEAKRHRHPIKRELVQVLHQKVHSVGAHKGVMISTAPYQRGAVEFAKVHGIALATVTEGRFTFETKAASQTSIMSRQEAFERYSLPTFVAHSYGPGTQPGSITVTLLSPEYPEYVAREVLGLPCTDQEFLSAEE